MKEPKKINTHPHDPQPPKYGGADQPLDYSDQPTPSQSILPMSEPMDKPPLDLQ